MWFFYSLFFAMWSSIALIIVKRSTKTIEPLPLLFILFLFNVPSTFILLVLTQDIPKVTHEFYLYVGLSTILDTIAFISLFSAIKKAAVSLLAPLASFNPVFTTVLAALFLQEIPTINKFMGVLLVVIGAYLLNVSDIKQGMFAPFRTLFRQQGVRLYLLANGIWAITPILQKKAIFETDPQVPLYASFIGMCFVTIALIPFALRKALSYRHQIPRHFRLFIPYGIGTAFAQLAAFSAFAVAPVGYVSAIMRLSGLFTVVGSGVLLKEQRIKERILGASVMLIGVLLLAL